MYEKYFKRPLDFILSLIALILLSPVLLITALIVRIKLGSPVLFKQDRPGLNEKIFTMYKFRTMTDELDKDGELLPDEQRLNNFGKLLRSTSLDELPSLFNILKGDMSIIGPRPLVIRYLPYYTSDEKKRHLERPGLTGLAQINGRNNLNWDERFSLDIKYVENISFKKDLMIIIQTFFKVIKKSDITSGDEMRLKDLDVERQNSYKKSK